MYKLKVISKKHGAYTAIFDEIDYKRLIKLGGKWCVVIKRGNPYFQKRISKRHLVELHRWIMGEPIGKYVDHINKNTLDNRRCNLRICTNSANLRNGRIRVKNTSGTTGVCFDKSRMKWQSKIIVKYKNVFLGRFVNIDDAIKARKEAEVKYWSI
jgi:hypothetical protein